MSNSTSRIRIQFCPGGEGGYAKLDPRIWELDVEYMARRIGTTRSTHSRLCTERASRYFEAAKTLVDLCRLLRYTQLGTDGITAMELTVDALDDSPVACLNVVGEHASFEGKFVIQVDADETVHEFFMLGLTGPDGLTHYILADQECPLFYTNPNGVLSYQENFPVPSEMIQIINRVYDAITMATSIKTE